MVKPLNMNEMMGKMKSAMMISNHDLAFLQGMIAHHEGAIGMCDTALRDCKNKQVLDLAKKIKKDQIHQVHQMNELKDKV